MGEYELRVFFIFLSVFAAICGNVLLQLLWIFRALGFIPQRWYTMLAHTVTLHYIHTHHCGAARPGMHALGTPQGVAGHCGFAPSLRVRTGKHPPLAT